MRRSMIVCAMLVSLAGFGWTEEEAGGKEQFTGRGMGVRDDATLMVLREGRIVKVSLYGIKVPPTSQDAGAEAKQFVTKQVMGKVLTVVVRDTAPSGDLTADVLLPDGKNLGHELLKVGMAQVAEEAAGDETLSELEKQAKEENKGLWAAPPEEIHTVGPWQGQDPNDLKEWNPTSGSWHTARGEIIGVGNCALDFKYRLPQNATLDFYIKVVRGKRPRVEFMGNDFWFGTAGRGRTFFLHGEGIKVVSGTPFPYINGKRYKVSLTIKDRDVIMVINRRHVVQARRSVVKPFGLRLRGGDARLRGVTAFSQFRIERPR